MKAIRWTLLLCLALVLSACASTKLRSSWTAPEFKGPPVKKVAIFMLHKDENLRRFAEDQAARSFPRGTQVVQSYRLFDKPEQNLDKIKEGLSKEGFDGVLMARTISVDRTQEYVPPQTVSVPTGPILVGPTFSTNDKTKNLDVFYTYVWGNTYQTLPGYTADVTTVIVETVLYRLPTGEALWSGVSETRNPHSQAEMVQDLVELVEKQLSKGGLIAER